MVAEGVQYFVRTAGASFSVSGAGTIVYRPSIAAPRRIAWVARDGKDPAEMAHTLVEKGRRAIVAAGELMETEKRPA